MSDINKECIGSRIASLRKDRNWTQAVLAERLEITDKAVSKWERSESEPNLDMIKRIGLLFEVSVGYLIDGDSSLDVAEKKDETKTVNAKAITQGVRNDVFVNGLLDIDKLIGADNYNFYLEMINYPATEFERLICLARNGEYKPIFDTAIENNYIEIIKCFRNNKIENLETVIMGESSKKWDIPSNKKYFSGMHKKGKLVFERNGMIFSETLSRNGDIRFWQNACKGDLDSVLEKVLSESPENYDVQKLLLDAGAKLHRRWIDLPGDEYETHRDEVDEVATNLLKNQIKILLGE